MGLLPATCKLLFPIGFNVPGLNLLMVEIALVDGEGVNRLIKLLNALTQLIAPSGVSAARSDLRYQRLQNSIIKCNTKTIQYNTVQFNILQLMQYDAIQHQNSTIQGSTK